MFCRSTDFWDCDGFDQALPIMEDGDLCLKLVKKGRIYQVNRIVQSSDRRVAKWGSFKATAIYLYIGFLWGLALTQIISNNFIKIFADSTSSHSKGRKSALRLAKANLFLGKSGYILEWKM